MSFGLYLSNLGTSAARFSNVAPATKTSSAATVAKNTLPSEVQPLVLNTVAKARVSIVTSTTKAISSATIAKKTLPPEVLEPVVLNTVAKARVSITVPTTKAISAVTTAQFAGDGIIYKDNISYVKSRALDTFGCSRLGFFMLMFSSVVCICQVLIETLDKRLARR